MKLTITLLIAINLIFLSNQNVYSEEKEVNIFCKSDFRNGKNYSYDFLKKKIYEGLNINDKCTEVAGNGLDYILMNIKKPEALDLLIKSGAIFNKKSNQYAWMLKASPLHLAARGYLPETIPFLIKKGFKVNKKDKDGNTPMHYACMKGNVKILKEFILHGADYKFKDFRNKKGYSCLTLATFYQNSFEAIKFIYSLDTPKKLPRCIKYYVGLKNCHSYTKIYLNGLTLYPEKYDKKILQFFKNKGDNLKEYYQSDYGDSRTHLHDILQRNNEENYMKVKLNLIPDLIELGADINQAAKSVNKTETFVLNTPIFHLFTLPEKHRPILNNLALQTLDLMIKLGADLNHIGEWSNYAIHIASRDN